MMSALHRGCRFRTIGKHRYQDGGSMLSRKLTPTVRIGHDHRSGKQQLALIVWKEEHCRCQDRDSLILRLTAKEKCRGRFSQPGMDLRQLFCPPCGKQFHG
jgi:hypothetical protein